MKLLLKQFKIFLIYIVILHCQSEAAIQVLKETRESLHGT